MGVATAAAGFVDGEAARPAPLGADLLATGRGLVTPDTDSVPEA
jgi:hypothetical protein